MLNHTQATLKRLEFNAQLPPGVDNLIVPKFYADIAENFHFAIKDKKIALIIVGHFVHSLPYLLECVTSLGDVAALISKQSGVVKMVRRTISKIYDEIIFPDVNKYNLHDDPEVARIFLSKILKDQKWSKHQFIILDHGGYFAPRIHDVLPEFNDRIAGVVEHTWNGEVKYRDGLAQQHPQIHFPILTIAHSDLKGLESEAVADSIVDALSVNMGGKGLGQSINTLKHILILGYGHIGKAVAEVLKKRLGQDHIYICDTFANAQDQARKYFPADHVTGDKNEFLSQADLIITATSSKVLTRDDFPKLKTKVIIACATSSDDQFSADALQDYKRLTPEESSQPCVEYQHKARKDQLIYLVADGDSINFSIGSTSHPIIHTILASICVSGHRLIANLSSLNPGEIHQTTREDDQLIIKTYENIFGPLVKKDLVKIAERLKTYYQGDCTYVKRLFGDEIPLNEAYVNLAIVDQEQTTGQRNSPTKQAFARHLPSYEDTAIKLNSSHIDLDDIFNPAYYHKMNREMPRRVLALGRAGIGKTTLGKRIAHLSTQNNPWPQFKVVLLIKLRELNEINFPKPHPTLADVIEVLFLSKLTPDEKVLNRAEVAEIWRKCLEEASEETLYILDGYDEFRLMDSPCKPIIDELLTQKVNGKFRYVLLTSRPFYAYQRNLDLTVEVRGFTSENIQKYVKKFFKEPGTAEQLLQYLEKNKLLYSLAYFPINLELICSIADMLPLDGSDTLTMTKLYLLMSEKLWISYLEREDIKKRLNENEANRRLLKHLDKLRLPGFRKLISEEEDFLMKLALLSQMEDRIMLDADFLARASDPSESTNPILEVDVKKTNFLTTNDHKDNENKKQYFFIHDTFRQFFVALYLSQFLLSPQSKNKLVHEEMTIDDFIIRYKFNPRFEIVWWFVAGLIKGNKNALNHFFNLLLAEPHDLFGSEEILLLMRCLDEAGLSKDLQLKDKLVSYILRNIERFLPQSQNTFIKHLARQVGISLTFSRLDSLQALMLHSLDKTETMRNTFYVLEYLPYKTSELIQKMVRVSAQKAHAHHWRDQDQTVYAAIDAFEKTPDARVITTLLEALNAYDASLNIRALEALAKLQRGDDIIVNNVIASFFHGFHDSVPKAAIETFKKIAHLNPSFPHKLLNIIDGDFTDIDIYLDRRPDDDKYGDFSRSARVAAVKKGAVEALKYLQQPHDEVIRYLFVLLEIVTHLDLPFGFQAEIVKLLTHFALMSEHIADKLLLIIQQNKQFISQYTSVANVLARAPQKNNYLHHRLLTILVSDHSLMVSILGSLLPEEMAYSIGREPNFSFVRSILKKTMPAPEVSIGLIQQIIGWIPILPRTIQELCDFILSTDDIEACVATIKYLTYRELPKGEYSNAVADVMLKVIRKYQNKEEIKITAITYLIKKREITCLVSVRSLLNFKIFQDLYAFDVVKELCSRDSQFVASLVKKFIDSNSNTDSLLSLFQDGRDELQNIIKEVPATHNNDLLETLLSELNQLQEKSDEFPVNYKKRDIISLLEHWPDEKVTLILITAVRNTKPDLNENNAPEILGKRELSKKQIYQLLDQTDREDILDESLKSTPLITLIEIYLEHDVKTILKIFCARFVSACDYIYIENDHLIFYESYNVYRCAFDPRKKDRLVKDFELFSQRIPFESKVPSIHEDTSKVNTKRESVRDATKQDETAKSLEETKEFIKKFFATMPLGPTLNFSGYPGKLVNYEILQMLLQNLITKHNGIIEINLGFRLQLSHDYEFELLLQLLEDFPEINFAGRIETYIGSKRVLSLLNAVLVKLNSRDIRYMDTYLGWSLYLTSEYQAYQAIIGRREDERFTTELPNLNASGSTELYLSGNGNYWITNAAVPSLISYLKLHPHITRIRWNYKNSTDNFTSFSPENRDRVDQCLHYNRKLKIKKLFQTTPKKHGTGKMLDLTDVMLVDQCIDDLVECLGSEVGREYTHLMFAANAMTDVGASKLASALPSLNNIVYVMWNDASGSHDSNEVSSALKTEINAILRQHRSQTLLQILSMSTVYSGRLDLSTEDISEDNINDLIIFIKDNPKVRMIIWPDHLNIPDATKLSIDIILKENQRICVKEYLLQLQKKSTVEAIDRLFIENIRDAGAIELAKGLSQYSKTLRKCDLSYLQISDEGMRLLLEFFHTCPLLTEIKIIGNPVSDKIFQDAKDICFNNRVRLSREKIMSQLQQQVELLDLTEETVDNENCDWLMQALMKTRSVTTIRWGECSIISFSKRMEIEKVSQDNFNNPILESGMRKTASTPGLAGSAMLIDKFSHRKKASESHSPSQEKSKDFSGPASATKK